MRLRHAKTAEQIKILFGMKTLEGPRNVVFEGNRDLPTRIGSEEHVAQVYLYVLTGDTGRHLWESDYS